LSMHVSFTGFDRGVLRNGRDSIWTWSTYMGLDWIGFHFEEHIWYRYRVG
jgi:hypothetical protein